jgi:hypothetical protein
MVTSSFNGLRAIEELQSLDEKTLAEAVQVPTDYSVLLSALNTEEALASIRAHDPLAGARLRGLEAKRKLLEVEGGALSTAQIAGELQVTRQAVDKRRKERKLLRVEVWKKGFRYPVWQKLVSPTWYEGGYRAQIVAYSCMRLAGLAQELGSGLNYLKIWSQQFAGSVLEEQLLFIGEQMAKVLLFPPRAGQNVGEWAKQKACRKTALEMRVKIVDNFED